MARRPSLRRRAHGRGGVSERERAAGDEMGSESWRAITTLDAPTEPSTDPVLPWPRLCLACRDGTALHPQSLSRTILPFPLQTL